MSLLGLRVVLLEGVQVTEVVQRNPKLSAHKIAGLLKISSKGAWGLLKRLGLSREKERISYRSRHLPKGSLNPRRKLTCIRSVETKKLSVSQACRRYSISRKTFYKWWRRYQKAKSEGESILKALSPKERLFNSEKIHGNASPHIFVNDVLNVVKKNPHYSVHQIAKHVPLSPKGVWGILKKLELSREKERRRFQRRQMASRPWTWVAFLLEYLLVFTAF